MVRTTCYNGNEIDHNIIGIMTTHVIIRLRLRLSLSLSRARVLFCDSAFELPGLRGHVGANIRLLLAA